MNRHPVYGRPRRRGQLLPKRIVSLIANTDPIDGTKNHRTILPQDHNASGAQAQIPDIGDRIVCQARSDGRSGIQIEKPHPQLSLDGNDQHTGPQ
jgi:hypothetical protein